MLGVAEDRLERADAATRDAGATGCLSATASRPGLCSLAVLHVGLHLLDDRNCQMLDDPVPDQRANMRADAALIQVERRCFDGDVLSAENVPGPSLFEIPVAHLGNRHTLANLADFVGGIFSNNDLSQFQFREIASPVDSQHAKAPKVHTTLNALGISILNDKGLDAGRHDPKTEALYIGIPQNELFRFWRNEGVYGPLSQLHYGHSHLLLETQPQKSPMSPMCLQIRGKRGQPQDTIGRIHFQQIVEK